MELTIIETSAYQDLKKQLSMLSVQMMDFQKKIAPVTPDMPLAVTVLCEARTFLRAVKAAPPPYVPLVFRSS